MRARSPLARTGLALLAVCLLASPVAAGGFALIEQDARAAGLGGAFTARADDASALFFNPGGLAFLAKGTVTVGTTATTVNRAQLQGLATGRAAGVSGEQDQVRSLAPQLFAAKPFSPRLSLAAGVFSPFGFEDDWRSPAAFPGRFVGLSSRLRTFDAATGFGLRLGRHLGVGGGLIYRSSDLTLSRRIELFNPLVGQTGLPQDVATLDFESDFATGFGWTAGFLYRPTARLSWGVVYRSAITVDYGGSAVLTQIATGNDQFDDLLASALPFDKELPAKSRLAFPASASAGVDLRLGRRARLSADVGWIGWSSVRELPAELPDNPEFDLTLPLQLEDGMSYRLGFAYARWSGTEWRFGYASEAAVQPSDTLGPVLADAASQSLSVGVGRDWLDVAVVWTRFADRTTVGNTLPQPSIDPAPLDATYRRELWRLVVSVTK